MKKMLKTIALSAAFTLSAVPAFAQTSLDDLLNQVKSNRAQDAKINAQRESEFQSARADKQALLRKAQADLKAEEARGERLRKQYADNEITLAEKEVELENALGTLGEMFGVVRQVSAEAYGRISTSIVSAEHAGRADFLRELSEESRELPKIPDLEELWFALQTEMTESGKVSRFQAEVINLDGTTESQEVVRIGSYTILGKDGYLQYNSGTEQLQPFPRQPEGRMVSSALSFMNQNGTIEALYVDPTQGQILGIQKDKATLLQRYHAGGLPGYIITGIFVLGFLIGFYKIITLTLIGGKINGQLKNIDNPSSKNPLGRILAVYKENKNADAENLELKLDEAILKELPSIDSGINLIKILAAIAPLLGLLGTVIGMIATFQQITLFGTGDPRIMAGSISMALVTTAEGIIAALPLILLHSVVAGRSKKIVHILDEQSAGIIAAHSEGESA